jgi:hypothetical protein
MRLSDARLRRGQTKLIYLDHRLPPWLTEDAARDRSNRLLADQLVVVRMSAYPKPEHTAFSVLAEYPILVSLALTIADRPF